MFGSNKAKMDALKPTWFKMITACLAIAAYLGSKNLVQDLQTACGNWLDNDLVRAFTVFSLIYLRVEDIIVTLVITVAYLALRAFAMSNATCKPEDNTNVPIFPYVSM